jgi:benzoyl-CoA reductase subunit D
MITAGIDVGSRDIKAVLVCDGQPAGRYQARAGFELAREVEEALDAALAEAGASRGDVAQVGATGAGREEVPGAAVVLTDITCAARAAAWLVPGCQTVVDVGAEEARAVRLGPGGRVVDFAVNERCAAGSGAFSEALARALEVSLDELGPLSLGSTRQVTMNAQCVVFAESEVVSMIHDNVAPADIARAVHEAMAARTATIVRRIGLREPAALVGGMARNSGFVDALRRALGLQELTVPRGPEHAAALGAALAAAGVAEQERR